MNDQEFVCKNMTEELVDMYLDDCMKKAGMCTCARCRADVKAYALNNLPPHYVVSRLGNFYVRLNASGTQAQADIITAITSGINLVRESPRH